MSYKVSVVIEKDEYGYYAYAPLLSGCQTQADTLDDVLSNMKEATEIYLETLNEEEKKAAGQAFPPRLRLELSRTGRRSALKSDPAELQIRRK